MTLDEAIKHCEEVSEHNLISAKKYKRDKNDRLADALEYDSSHNKQLAQWLKELKKYRAIFEKVGKILADNGYTIDDLDTIFGKVNGEVNADEDSD